MEQTTYTAHTYTQYQPNTRLIASGSTVRNNPYQTGSMSTYHVSSENTADLPMLLRTLKTLSQLDKWLLFIGIESVVDKNVLIAAGVDIRKIRVVHADNISQARRYIRAVSGLPHYAAVICDDRITDLDPLNDDQAFIKISLQRKPMH